MPVLPGGDVVTRDTDFQPLNQAPAPMPAGDGRSGVRALLRRQLVARFQRLTGAIAVIVRCPASSVPATTPRTKRSHPLCRQCERPTACREVWQAHVDHLRLHGRPHWHRCPSGHWCGVAPIAGDDSELLACRLLCDGAMQRGDFCDRLALLAVLVEGLRAPTHSQHAESEREAEARAQHAQVRRAIEIVRSRLRDDSLSVQAVAREVGMNSTYLGHLFREQVGLRMSQYIAEQRVELASRLLRTTDWQIKRIAHESGHRCTDWFSQVFRHHTGISPTQFRRQAHSDEHAPA